MKTMMFLATMILMTGCTQSAGTCTLGQQQSCGCQNGNMGIQQCEAGGIYGECLGCMASLDGGSQDGMGQKPDGGCEPGQCTPTTLAKGQSIVALATDTQFLYWADHGGGSGFVGAVPKAGGAQGFMIYTGQGGTQAAPNTVVADGTNVYWYTQGGTLMRYLLPAGPSVPFVQNQLGTHGLTSDPFYVYWTKSGGPPTMQRAQVGGGQAMQVAQLTADGLTEGLVRDGQNLFWLTYDGMTTKLVTVGTDGTGLKQLASTPGMSSGGLAARAGAVYWSVVTDMNAKPAVLKTTLAGQTSIVVEDPGKPTGVAVDDKYVYWVTAATMSISGEVGQLERAPVGGGASEVLVDNQPLGLSLVTTDDVALYWTDGATIWRVTKS